MSVRQQVQNLVDAPVRFGWVEHPVFNAKFLGGQELRFGTNPNHRPAPVVPSPGSGFTELEGSDGRCVVALPLLRRTLELTWDASVLPHAYARQEWQHLSVSPWNGRGDGVGIEPASHPSGHPPVGLGPNILGPGRSYHARLTHESHVFFQTSSGHCSGLQSRLYVNSSLSLVLSGRSTLWINSASVNLSRRIFQQIEYHLGGLVPPKLRRGNLFQ